MTGSSQQAPPGRRLRRGVRPERYAAPVFLAVTLLLAWAGVAHASGSGWVQAVGAVAAGVIAVGMVGPGFAAGRLRATATSCPRDARAGEELSVEVTAGRPLRCTPVWPPGDPVLVEPGAPATVRFRLPTRGVLRTVSVRLATAAPLGLLWWSVDQVVVLPAPVEVAPRVGTGSSRGGEAFTGSEGQTRPVPSASGDPRGVRPYRLGDSRRRVHWRGSAHTGTLMVRESERQPDSSVRVVADLPEDPQAAERRAEEVMATVAALLAAGRRVLLETVEEGNRRCAPVSDRRHAGRRLARAGENPYRQDPGRARP
jgi:uncharacterized protein (DUF58 family)